MNMNILDRHLRSLTMIPVLELICLAVIVSILAAPVQTVAAAPAPNSALNSAASSADKAVTSSDPANPADRPRALPCPALLSHSLRPLMQPEATRLCDEHAGKVLLLVNTASQCGFTPQFRTLNALHRKYADRGFEVLGFPSGDFRQELESEADVARFCELNYGVDFAMYQKVHVTGKQAHPLFGQLAEQTGTYPRWNFNKYLIARDGTPVAHYDSIVQPTADELIKAIEALL